MLIIRAGRDKEIATKFGRLGTIHLLFQLSLMMNLTTVLVYWSILHKVEIKLYMDHHPYKWAHMYNVHIIPSLALLVNYVSLDIRFCHNHWKFFMVFSVAYGIVNFFSTKLNGKPVYWFLPWDSVLSLIVYASLMSIAATIWIVLSEISYSLKPIKHQLETKRGAPKQFKTQ